MKFKDIPYKRPDTEAEAQALKALAEGIQNAKSYEELRKLYVDHDASVRDFNDMMSIARIRNTLDTTDPFYAEEWRYLSAERVHLSLEEKKVCEALLASPYVQDFEQEFGSTIIKDWKGKLLLSNEAAVDDKVREAELQQEYSKVAATCKTDFRGESCNFYGLLKHMQSTDRAERREAFEAWAALYESVADQLDSIYDEMINVRCSMAKKLGFDSYIDMAYLQRRRYDYTPADVANFRKQVRDVLVPAVQKLYDRQRERLGVDTLYYYDESLNYPEGNAVPHGTIDELLAAAQEMYHELSPETADYFDRMVEDEMFDLESRHGKRGGGYCSSLPGKKLAFIFANFNGTDADAEVLTHEAGHGFADYCSSRTQPLVDLMHTTSEVAEIHSMTMELWTTPWMDKFFGDEAEKYVNSHLAGALSKIPYMVSVDEFQHRVFENPGMSAKERRAVWHELETIYLPWRNYDGNKFLTEGGFWMQKQHIFLYPFYYVDYALAQLCAFQFYNKMKQDKNAAWEDYLRLCRAGGSKGYFDLIEYANLEVPMKDGAVARSVQGVFEELGL